jgi:hypothetical protein
MKKTAAVALALFLVVPLVSTASADEAEELRNECRLVGEQHGISSERMAEWIDRCMENIRKLQREREQQGQHGQHSEQGRHGQQNDGAGHRGGDRDHGQ